MSPFPDAGGTRRSGKFRKHTQPSLVLCCEKAVEPQTWWDGGAEQLWRWLPPSSFLQRCQHAFPRCCRSSDTGASLPCQGLDLPVRTLTPSNCGLSEAGTQLQNAALSFLLLCDPAILSGVRCRLSNQSFISEVISRKM